MFNRDTIAFAEVLYLIRGMYTAAAGALVAQSSADTIANNLANVNTGGFKKTLLEVESTETMPIYRIQTDPGSTKGTTVPGKHVMQYVGPLGFGSRIYDTPVQFEQGPLQRTDNHMDLGLYGPGLFTIQTQNGIRYTRDGNFLINQQGLLSTQDGALVLGQRGAIPVPLGTDLTVTTEKDGTLSVNGRYVDKVRITSFSDTRFLRKEGDNRFVDEGAGPQIDNTTSVNQGTLERSNSNVVRSMVDLIVAQRWFEANEKVLQTEDEATGRSINEVGRTQH